MDKFGIREPMHAVPGVGSDWEALTAAEQQIAAMVSNGLSNPEIATRMSLPRRIVQAHVVQIMAKLGVGSRSEIRKAS
jgi:DNA-binding CsgD family transcriptional regulator